MTSRPPRLAGALVSWACGTHGEFLRGDLDERFDREVANHPVRARTRYWSRALRTVIHAHRWTIASQDDMFVERRSSPMRNVSADLRFVVRLLIRQPLYSIVAILSLALAVAANGVAFGVVDNLVFNPFQFPDADRLVSVGSTFPKLSAPEGFIEQHSPAEIDDMRRAPSLEYVAAFDLGNRAVSNGETAERVFTALVLDDPLPALGRPPAAGRGFSTEELAPRGPMVAMISYQLWVRMFAANPDIIGRAIDVNSQSRVVVGVMAKGVTLLGTDLWIPWGASASDVRRNQRQFTVIARIAPGRTIAQANAELATTAGRTIQEFSAQFPEYQGWTLRAVPWTEAVTGEVRGPARLLLLAGVVVLLIACANVASLMLTRLSVRRREIAVRYALGAGGWQVTRLLLLESGVLTFGGAALGLLLAYLSLPAVVRLLPVMLANVGTVQIDARVVGYCALVGFAAALLVTVTPAWQSRRASPQPLLRDGGGTTGSRQRFRNVLVVAELALAVVLLVGASLLLRSYARIQAIDPGFKTDRLLTMRLTLAAEKYVQPSAVQEFFRELLERLRVLPEVEAAGATSQFPPQETFTVQFRVDGAPAPTKTLPNAFVTTISPGFFDVLQMPLKSGRSLQTADRSGAPVVAVVNETFMKRFLDGRPSGRLVVGSTQTPVEVVGVVADTHNDSLLRPAASEMFVNIDQAPWNNQLFLIVRTRSDDPSSALPAVRRVVASLDPQQPLYLIQTMEQAMAGSVSSQRIGLTLVGTFAIAALAIACIGIYGVVSFWVAVRQREIGIRVALGASARQVTGLVAGQTAKLVALGALLGMAGGIGLGSAASSLLYNTAVTDPLALAAVVMVLAGVAFIASYVPSRRAVDIDPVRVLKTE